MAVFIPTGCRPSATQSSHYAPLMAGYLGGLPTAGFSHCSLFTLSGMDKWAEGPMVCSPGQSDRRERRPGCMPIYLAAATRHRCVGAMPQFIPQSPSSMRMSSFLVRLVILPCGGHVPTAALPSVALPQAIQRRAFSPTLPWVFPTDRAPPYPPPYRTFGA